MRVLITYGSKRGGTAGIARMLSGALAAKGFDTEVRLPDEVEHIVEYDAIVVGGALYYNRWPRDVSAFVRRHRDELLRVPVWMFSSGPLDDRALRESIPPTNQVQQFLDRTAAQGHITFGGRLEPNAKGFFARRMAKTKSGDFRDAEQVQRWADQIAHVLVRDLYPAEEERPTEAERAESGWRPQAF